MRVSTALRLTGAVWFVPLTFAVCVYLAVSDPDYAYRAGYVTADLASASRAVAFAGPLLAAFVALKFRSFSRIVSELRPRRSGVIAVMGVWGWLLLGSPLAVVLGILSATQSLPADAAGWEILLVVFTTALACGSLGLAVSRVVTPVIAIPGVALGTFAWLALPAAGTNVVLRNINSAFVGCCTPSEVPARPMVVGSMALVSTVIFGCWVMLVPRWWSRQPRLLLAGMAVATLASALRVGVATAEKAGDPLTLLAVQQRSTPLTCRAEAGIRACAWPEEAARLPEVLDAIRTLNAGLDKVGLAPVTEATENVISPQSIEFGAPPQARQSDILFTLILSYVSRETTCSQTQPPHNNFRAYAFVGLLSGLKESDLANRGITGSSIQAAARAVQMDVSDARDWFAQTVCPGR